MSDDCGCSGHKYLTLGGRIADGYRVIEDSDAESRLPRRLTERRRYTSHTHAQGVC